MDPLRPRPAAPCGLQPADSLRQGRNVAEGHRPRSTPPVSERPLPETSAACPIPAARPQGRAFLHRTVSGFDIQHKLSRSALMDRESPLGLAQTFSCGRLGFCACAGPAPRKPQAQSLLPGVCSENRPARLCDGRRTRNSGSPLVATQAKNRQKSGLRLLPELSL